VKHLSSLPTAQHLSNIDTNSTPLKISNIKSTLIKEALEINSQLNKSSSKRQFINTSPAEDNQQNKNIRLSPNSLNSPNKSDRSKENEKQNLKNTSKDNLNQAKTSLSKMFNDDDTQSTSSTNNELKPVLIHLDQNEKIWFTNPNNAHEVEQSLLKHISGLFTHYKPDKNNNICITPSSKEAISKILSTPEFFPNRKKIDLNERFSSYLIMINNLSYELATNNSQTLGNLGIDRVEKVIRKDGSEAKFLKAFCSNNEARIKLLNNKIILNHKLYNVEPNVRIKQCDVCLRFGHTSSSENKCKIATEKPCTEEPLCKNCCLSQDIKVDCLKKHSAFNRGCPIFKKYKSQLIQEALVEIKQGVSNLSVSSIFFGSTHSLNSPNSPSFNSSSINNIADIINSCLDNKF
jgi:hypothetical protein